MYRTQHNDGREGEVGMRGEREGDKGGGGVDVKRRKEEEKEITEGER